MQDPTIVGGGLPGLNEPQHGSGAPPTSAARGWTPPCGDVAANARTVLHALQANECAAYRSFFEAGAALHGKGAFSVREEGRGTLFMCPALPEPGIFNRALGLDAVEEGDEDESVLLLQDILRRYAKQGLPMAVDLAPEAVGKGLSMALRSAGLRKAALSALLVRHSPASGASPASQPGLPQTGLPGRDEAPCRTALATTVAERQAVAAICAEVFGVGALAQHVLEALDPMAGWRHWLAFVGARPVAAALSFMHEGRCWFGWAATLPAFRGQGCKGALDDIRVAHAEASGCDFISTDTALGTTLRPDPSLRSLRRRGFEVVSLRATYLKAPVAHRPAAHQVPRGR